MERNEEATASLHVLRGSTSLLDLKQRETTQRELNQMIETIGQEKTDQSDTWTYMWTNKTSRKRLSYLLRVTNWTTTDRNQCHHVLHAIHCSICRFWWNRSRFIG